MPQLMKEEQEYITSCCNVAVDVIHKNHIV